MIQFIQDSADRKWLGFVWDVRDDPSMFAAAALKHHVEPSSIKFLLVVPHSAAAWASVTRVPTARHLFVPDLLVTRELNGMLLGGRLPAVPNRRHHLMTMVSSIVAKLDDSAKKVIQTLGQ